MVAKNKATTGKGRVKKLKLKRETIKDLDVKSKSGDVKAGAGKGYRTALCPVGTGPTAGT